MKTKWIESTLFNVNSNNLINEESITFNDFKEDFSEEKPTEKNQNYIFNKERKKYIQI